MRTYRLQFRPHAHCGVLIPIGSRARRGLLVAAALLALPAWRAPAAAQDREAPRPPDARVAVAQDLAAQAQDTVPVIRCCVQPPAGLRFWAPFNGSYVTAVPGFAGNPQGVVSWTTSLPPGHTGSALSLQASGRVDYLSSATTSLGTGNFTVDAWIRVPQTTTGVNPFLDNRLTNPLRGFQLFAYNGRIGFQMADATSAPGYDNFVAPANTILAPGTWHFVAVTVTRNSPTGGRIYVDCNLVLTFDPTKRQGSLGTNNRLTIGHDLNNVWGQGAAFDIDEVEIFHRALTPAEVAALCRYPKCRPTAMP
ncbi:MAG: LamG domain-containing protein [Longimicrobiaceae bacterium]